MRLDHNGATQIAHNCTMRTLTSHNLGNTLRKCLPWRDADAKSDDQVVPLPLRVGDNDDGDVAALAATASGDAERGAALGAAFKRTYFALHVAPSGPGVQPIQHEARMVPEIQKSAW